MQPVLVGVHPAKVKLLAEEAASSHATNQWDFSAEKRLALLVCLIQSAQTSTRDESLRAALERKDEELSRLHQSNQDLREGLKQAIIAISSLREQVKTLEGQIGCLQERIHTLEGQQAKDSHNSSLPPSSDRFIRPVKSLRQKSGKKPDGQAGHRGHHFRQAQIPDEILLHQVQHCEHCQHDLHLQPAALPQARQVIDLPTKRVWIEHWVEEKQCPQCYHLTRAPFPAE